MASKLLKRHSPKLFHPVTNKMGEFLSGNARLAQPDPKAQLHLFRKTLSPVKIMLAVLLLTPFVHLPNLSFGFSGTPYDLSIFKRGCRVLNVKLRISVFAIKGAWLGVQSVYSKDKYHGCSDLPPK